MSAASERQRIGRFAELLDDAEVGRRHHRRTEVDTQLSPLVTLARRMDGGTEPGPTEEFQGGLRAMLMAKIEREGIGSTAIENVATDKVPTQRSAVRSRPEARSALLVTTQLVRQVPTRDSGRTRGSGRTRAAILIGVVAGALALSGVSLASTSSVPGDALYSVKRSSEQAQLVLAGSDSSRGQLHLEFAKSRLVESRHVEATEVDSVLAAMDVETVAGASLLFASALQHGDGASIDAVMAFVSQQRTSLTQMRLTMATAANPLRRSLDLLSEIEARANRLRAAMLSGCDTVTLDALGPKPTC